MKHFLALVLVALVDPSLKPERPPPDALEKLNENVEKMQQEEREEEIEEDIYRNRYDVPENQSILSDDEEDKE